MTHSPYPHAQYQHTVQLRDSITSNLAAFKHQDRTPTDLAGAAVALVVSGIPRSLQTDTSPPDPSATDSACLLLTLRSRKLKKHAGQYALPGGKIDSGESVERAALRELQEELGITLPASNVLGTLDDFPTRSGFCITPVVVWNDKGTETTPNADEVEKVFEIPLEELFLPEIPHLSETDSSEHPILSMELPSVGTRMYTPTASIIFQFREVALLGRATRVSHYEQPKFAWR